MLEGETAARRLCSLFWGVVVMTPLRQRLVDDLRLRNYSPRTIEIYVAHVARFAKHFGRSPELLGAEEVRAFQLHLLERKVSWSQFNQSVCALRYFYGKTLGRTEVLPMLAFGKRPKKLPCVLSPEEVAQLLEAARPGRERVLLQTTYACGLRLMEVLNLQVSDIDSARMLVHVRQAKGNKDRLVPLSAKLLAELRNYWRCHRPARWLFGAKGQQGPVHPGTVQRQFRRAVRKAGLRKPATMHTLRHSYATHMLEAGVDVMTLQKILGHRQLSTTAHYLHLRGEHLQRLPNLLERLALPVPPSATKPPAAASAPTEASAPGGHRAEGHR
jgi:integrase/recombinase XerD